MPYQADRRQAEPAFWYVLFLSSPGLFFVVFGVLLMFLEGIGIGYGELDSRLRVVGLAGAFIRALAWGYVWGIVAPLPIGLLCYVYRRAGLRDQSKTSHIRFMRVAIALSMASWLIFAYHDLEGLGILGGNR